MLLESCEIGLKRKVMQYQVTTTVYTMRWWTIVKAGWIKYAIIEISEFVSPTILNILM